MRATGLEHRHATSLPPIHATIVAGEDDVSIRISDQGVVCTVVGLLSLTASRGWTVFEQHRITV